MQLKESLRKANLAAFHVAFATSVLKILLTQHNRDEHAGIDKAKLVSVLRRQN